MHTILLRIKGVSCGITHTVSHSLIVVVVVCYPHYLICCYGSSCSITGVPCGSVLCGGLLLLPAFNSYGFSTAGTFVGLKTPDISKTSFTPSSVAVIPFLAARRRVRNKYTTAPTKGKIPTIAPTTMPAIAPFKMYFNDSGSVVEVFIYCGNNVLEDELNRHRFVKKLKLD